MSTYISHLHLLHAFQRWLWWADLSQQLSARTAACSFSMSSEMGERTRRAKVRKNSGVEIKSLINEGERWGKSDGKAVIASHKQIDSQPVSEQQLVWKDHSSFFVVEHDVI